MRGLIGALALDELPSTFIGLDCGSYAVYVPEVLRLALESDSYQPIADHMTNIATEIMACAENIPPDVEIAKLILSLTKDEPYHPADTIIEVE